MTEKATFAAGCFWGVEVAFRNVPGVVDASVGYIGGTVPDPTYEIVCSGASGHAEAVEVEYDPNQVTYETLLDVFWNKHNPTTLNRQGLDIGTQYRSAIYYHDSEQQKIAQASMEALQKQSKYRRRQLVTEITPVAEYYQAEAYHQKYDQKKIHHPILIGVAVVLILTIIVARLF